ncbi:MAG: alpha/beta fold hydrolase [Chloroflexi bacterium]|nr:alpha/beta fold hydrolase [Chloroflexota bacterium]
MPVPLAHTRIAAARAEAPVVLLLHGLGSCGEDWGLQVPALRADYSLVLPDLRGQGRTPMPPGWPSIADLAADVRALMDGLGLASVHVVGLSLGGAVALQLAVDDPQRVRSLTAVNTFARLRVARGAARRGAERTWLAATGRMHELGRRVALGLFPEEGQEAFRQAAARRLADNRPANYLRLLSAVGRFDLRPRLAEIRSPTLVVAGEQDTTVPMECKLELARQIRGARLKVFSGSRHVTPLDRSPEFNACLLEFLIGVDGRLAHGAAGPWPGGGA